MKKLFFTIAIAAFMVACGSRAQQEVETQAETTQTECCHGYDETKICCQVDGNVCKKDGGEGCGTEGRRDAEGC